MRPAKASRLAAYVASFALGRGALFASPLLLANLLNTSDYGALETAQAAAALVAAVATIGTASVVPLVVTEHTRTATLSGIAAHHLALAGLCTVLALCMWLAGSPIAWVMVAIFTAAIALQSMASTHLKTLGRGEASVLLDAGFFGLMALAAVGAKLLGGRDAMSWVVGAALGYALVLGAAYVRILKRRLRAAEPVAWQAALLIGLPLMLGSMVSVLATTSGRLGMGLLGGPVVAADYAVLARAAALPVLAHQLILIARFRHLFTQPHDEVERASQQVVAMVAISAFAFVLVSPWLGMMLGPAFADAWASHHLAGKWIVTQAVLWSAIALNDLVISRHQVMGRVLPVTASSIVVTMGIAWFALHHLGASLEHFVYAHGAVMLLFYLVQSAAMAAHGVRLSKVWRMAVGSYLLLIGLATVSD